MRGPVLWPSPCPVSAGRVGAAVTSRSRPQDFMHLTQHAKSPFYDTNADNCKTLQMQSSKFLLPVRQHGTVLQNIIIIRRLIVHRL